MSSVAVDLNLSQSALLELKLAAIKHLNYEDYLLLLGENEDPLKGMLHTLQKLLHYFNHTFGLHQRVQLSLPNRFVQ